VWLAVYCVEVTARLLHQHYGAFGADLPGPTLNARALLQGYVPWLAACAVTVLLATLAARRSRHLGWATAASGTAALVFLALVVGAFALPLMKCGWSWWPGWSAEAPGVASACFQ
jgi:hypothetical protein